ncbi:MAG: universal stress protein [Alphaproteobacteria bacterium]
MGAKDILAIVRGDEIDGSAIAFAEKLAAQNDVFLTALLVGWMPPVPAFTENWVIDPDWSDLVRDSQKDLDKARGLLEARLNRTIEHSAVVSLFAEIGAARSALAPYPRHADVTIVSAPDRSTDSLGRELVIEASLFDSGRAIIVVPPNWRAQDIGRRVLVAWNAGREAARALGEAVSLLRPDAQVSVATVDAKPSDEGHGEWPGVDITTHLARHGFKADLRNLDSLGGSVAKTLIDNAVAMGADLIVMGGYGRSRLSEFLLGGATREMLSSSPVPVLMAH